MKYLKMFENLNNLKSKISMIRQYQNFLEDIEPALLFKYKEDYKEYEEDENDDRELVDLGNYVKVEIGEVNIVDDNNLRFTLKLYELSTISYLKSYYEDYENNKPELRYYFISVEDLENAIVEMDAKKYNL